MKKATAVLIFILILATFALTPSLAAWNIVITRQPQNGTFPEYSVASWSVEAAGDNLSYHWFIVYKGVTYDTNKSFAVVFLCFVVFFSVCSVLESQVINHTRNVPA